MVATTALLDGDALSLTELGRSIRGTTSAKHSIKRIDRLLGNPRLANDRLALLRWHANNLCRHNPMPVILVDWSDVREQLRLMTLRASIVLKGRSITLYERTFAWDNYNSPRSHNQFLRELADVLPSGAKPLIVTDAGYRNTWFREVESHGWYWLGRVRGDVSFTERGQNNWRSNKTLYPDATHSSRYIGASELAKRVPLIATSTCSKPAAKAARTGVSAALAPNTRRSVNTSKAARSRGYWQLICLLNCSAQRRLSGFTQSACRLKSHSVI